VSAGQAVQIGLGGLALGAAVGVAVLSLLRREPGWSIEFIIRIGFHRDQERPPDR
jgi:hypothetical protein